MRLYFTIFGKVKENYLKEGYEEYLKRLSKYGKCEIVYFDEVVSKDNSSSIILKNLEIEADRLLNFIKPNYGVILVDLHGKEYDSIEFSKEFEKIKEKYTDIVIVIGSSNGLSNRLRKRADLAISLSKLTTTHPLALLFSLEQVYRSLKIINNETYHK